MAPATDDVIAALDALREEVECCSQCVLASTRTKAVFGEGDAGADLMFVGEAPGYHEDQQGRPFVGQAGRLLEQLLASIGLTREQVYIANVLKSRPPNNRDPRPEEIDACRPYLFRQIEIIKPKVICTLGNFATKLLTGDPAGITKVHGRPQATEIAGHPLYLYPIFHPAAALYTPSMLDTLKADFSRLPELLAPAGAEPAGEAAALQDPATPASDAPPAAAASAPPVSDAPPAPVPGDPAPPAPDPALTEAAPTPEDASPVDDPSALDEAPPYDDEPVFDDISYLDAPVFGAEDRGAPVAIDAPDMRAVPAVPDAPADAAEDAPPAAAGPAELAPPAPEVADPVPEPPVTPDAATPDDVAPAPTASAPAPRPAPPSAGPPAEPEQLGLF